MKQFGLLAVVLVLWLHKQTVLSAKILFLCPTASPSHSLWFYSYIAVLAEKNHQITVLGVDEPKFKIPNLTKFIAHEVYEKTHEDLASEWASDDIWQIEQLHGLQGYVEVNTKAVVDSQALKDLIKSYKDVEKPFDLIVHDDLVGEALLGLVPMFGNPPLLLATAFSSPQWMTMRKGNIFNPAYVPSMITIAGEHMSFYERVVNTFYYVYIEWFIRYVMESKQNQILQETFGNNLPHVRDLTKRANVILVNQHFAIDGPRPLLPGVIQVSGLHIREARALPQDIKEFMDGAKDGVILLSFGTNVDSTWFPKDFENMILRVMSRLPQKVLWKWDKPLNNIPANVKVSKWLPQGDIQAHPNIRLFVSHCGLLSTQEAIFRKVPILALPMAFDQYANAAILERLNLTIQLNPYKLTEQKLQHSIREILTNPMYKRNIERAGSLVADAPLTAAQTAVYWTEYVIRHQGAPHLRSAAADMPLHQLMLLDVLLLVLVTLVATVWIFKLLLSTLYRKLLKSSVPKTKKE